MSGYGFYGICTQHAGLDMVGNSVGSLQAKSGVGWVNAGPGTRSELNRDTHSEDILRNCLSNSSTRLASISSSNGLCVPLISFESARSRRYLSGY